MRKLAVLVVLLLSVISEPVADSAVHTEEQCLSSVIYYESRGESLKGKRAVFDVIQNRMKKDNKTACQVVKASGQFSWYGLRPMKRYNKEMQELLTSVKEHDIVLINERGSKPYLWFFNRYIKPPWARNMACIRVDKHYFCREK